MQFDADTVGAPTAAADAEMAMMMADVMEAVGIKRGDYVIKVNNRRLLDGVMSAAEIAIEKRLAVLRAVDKLDRLGIAAVRQLLGADGRKDESGDFTKGVGLSEAQIEAIAALLQAKAGTNRETSAELARLSDAGVSELAEIAKLAHAAGYGEDRIRIDPSVVRGLEYYTGPVFEAELTFEVPNEKGQPVVFGSVGGGGRYDGLVGRFRGEDVPATGFSIGVSRLFSALRAIKSPIVTGEEAQGPVVVLVMDKERVADFQRMAQELRQAGIKAEMYLGGAGMKAQMKYADKRASPLVVIQGGDEKEKGEVQIKDLVEGARQARAIASHEDYKAARPAQFAVPEAKLVDAVKEALARQKGGQLAGTSQASAPPLP
jgi:histidyl-tRNA synthetase